MKNGQLALDDLATLQRRGQPTTPLLVVIQGGRLVRCTDLNDLARRVVELTPQGAEFVNCTWSWPGLDTVRGFAVRNGDDETVATCSILDRPLAELEAAMAAVGARP